MRPDLTDTQVHMPHFSTAWFDDKIEYWSRELAPLKDRPSLRFLEIGCFEGRATHWMLENILTHPTSSIDVIDTFEGSPEHEGEQYQNIIRTLRGIFEHNIEQFRSKVRIHQGYSQEVLPSFQMLGPVFDFIYVDGSHHQDDVYRDAVLVWPLLKDGGILAFDDYRWTWKDSITGEVQSPKIGINRFLEEYRGDFALLHKLWQLHVRKRPTTSFEQLLLSVRWVWPFSKLPIRRSKIVGALQKLGLATS
ncbi:MAG: class I SAM-dependent methyltransferase [Bacteroidota bacterium]|nr:class I SAM-dependent methyltransferase [Bacteroidota bacterium]MDP4231785.1 class I SAM-dependent methyltransferase [Bacteroidota bacterium]MDP4243520.1 class I SAM-dependent methyltransferase [Bacteroidota bacterium]MDP4287122.1 class I SAM-dependent methyltransferase [Bacteroidota bacterium]